MVAVAGASVSTRAERKKTSAIWATNSARKRRWFVTTTWTSAGALAIEYATRAVMARPAHIQPYTAFKNALTRVALSTLPLTSSIAAVPSNRSMSSSPLASSCAGGRAALLIASRLNLWHDNSSPSALSREALTARTRQGPRTDDLEPLAVDAASDRLTGGFPNDSTAYDVEGTTVAATEVPPTLAAPASPRYALGVIPVTRRNVVVK